MPKVTQAEYRERLNRIIRRIKRNPECHDQAVYHCGTAHCIAGHAQLDAKRISIRKEFNPISSEADSKLIEAAHDDGKKYLGLSDQQAKWLFSTWRTLEEIEEFAQRKVFKWVGV